MMEQTKKCTACGQLTDAQDRFCRVCGAPQQEENGQPQTPAQGSGGAVITPAATRQSPAAAPYVRPADTQPDGDTPTGGARVVPPESVQRSDGLDKEMYAPLSPWSYFGYMLLYAIPTVGFILAIVFSFTMTNQNAKNFARGYLILTIAVFILVIFFLFLAAALGYSVARGVMSSTVSF